MMRNRVRAAAATAVAGILTLSVTGCGSATVESDESSDTSLSQESISVTSTPNFNDGSKYSEPEGLEDGPVETVTSVPSAEDYLSITDEEYLKKIKEKKINPDGVENQLIGIGNVVCTSGDKASVDANVRAVAGQLIEQKHTSLPVDQATAAIKEAAENSYC